MLLDTLSMSDPLTGLPNRRALEKAFATSAADAARRGHVVAMAMVDVDFFKAYNDHYGHLAGDICLRQIGAALAAASAGRDVVARFGGEEFAIVLTGPSATLLTLAAERCRLAIEQLNLPHEGVGPDARVSISIGLQMLGGAVSADMGSALAAADRALYLAKRHGRNRVHLGSFDEADRAAAA